MGSQIFHPFLFPQRKEAIQKKSKSGDSLTPLAFMQLTGQILLKIEIRINIENTYLDLKTQQMAGGEGVGGERKKN